MTERQKPQFGAADVVELASKFKKDDKAFVIGGQATNLWAWYYQDRDPVLKLEGPFTSEDIDYFGNLAVAKSFAEATGGELLVPLQDEVTPNVAIVKTTINEKPIEIDFLHDVLGVGHRELSQGVVHLQATASVSGHPVTVIIKVMHPVSCLKSRIANMLSPATRRRDEISKRQLLAAAAVLTTYIDDALSEEPGWHDAKSCFKDLFKYLRSHEYGRVAHQKLSIDPLEILRKFENDTRIDPRYRQRQLAEMIKQISNQRASRDRRSVKATESIAKRGFDSNVTSVGGWRG